MNTSIHSRMILARRIAAACGAGVLLVGVAGCGSSKDPQSTNYSDTASNQQGGASNNQGAGQLPGADGKVAAVSGSTAQVQSQQNGQVAVTWTDSTTFTKQVSAKLADVKVGDCVMVSSADSADGGSAGSTPTQPTKVTAASVRITQPVNGSCMVAGGPQTGSPGGGPQTGTQGGGPQTIPEGSPEGSPEGGPEGGQSGPGNGTRPQFRGFGGAFGTVKAVSATGFTVTTTRPGSDTSVDVAVMPAKATTYTTTAKGAAADVKVGVCVRAEGRTDDTGAVAATRIQITPAVEGECGSAMVRFSNGGPGNDTKAS